MSLPRTASAVIIGGGVVGCSIAYHLARRGLHDVVVLERETVGSGTTSKAAGGIRVQFSSETEIRFSLESIRVFERFQEEFGVDPGYRKIGYLYLLSEERHLREFEKRIALQRTLGADVRVLTPADAQKLVPALRVDDLIAAVWGPQDGMAAGPAAARAGRLAGLELPVHPRRRHIFFTEPFPEIPGPVPLTSDVTSGFYFRKEMEQMLLSPGDVEDIGDDANVPMDWGKVEELVPKAIQRLPIIERARIAGGWAGLRPLTPDDHAIIGWAPGVAGFFLAVGFGGHGFQHSPATGRYVAEWLLDGQPSLDLAFFAPERFTRSP